MNHTALMTLALGVLSLAAPARADIILSIEPLVTGAPGSSGTFDVLLTNTGVSSQNIASFNFELSTTDANITFNDVTTGTTAMYIFPSSGTGPDIVTPPTGGQTIEAGDFDLTFNGTDVDAGQTYGIGSVAYSIDPAAVNGEIATIGFVDAPTSLSDSNFNDVGFTATPGSITVVSTSPVPEPAPALPLAALMLCGVLLIRRRRAAL